MPAITTYALAAVRPGQSLAESMDTGWIIRGRTFEQALEGVDAGHLISLTGLEDYLLSPDGNIMDFYTGDVGKPWAIWEAELSPDGRYAALLACSNREDSLDLEAKGFLFILRLSDMKMLTATGFMLNDMGKNGIRYQTALAHSMLNWSEAGLIFRVDQPELWQIKAPD